jgi:hypothetical protein
VRWAKSKSGKLMPVDLEPVEGGNIELTEDGDVLLATYVKPNSHPFQDRFVSHFSTCPNAATHRKK